MILGFSDPLNFVLGSAKNFANASEMCEYNSRPPATMLEAFFCAKIYLGIGEYAGDYVSEGETSFSYGVNFPLPKPSIHTIWNIPDYGSE